MAKSKAYKSIAQEVFDKYEITEDDIAEFSKKKYLTPDDRWNIASNFYKNKYGDMVTRCSNPDITITFPSSKEAKEFADKILLGINKETNSYIINTLHDDPVLYNRSLSVTSLYTTGKDVKLTVL